MDRFPPLSHVKTFNNNEQYVSSIEKDDKEFHYGEMNELEELVTNLQVIGDNFVTGQGDNRNITPKPQDEFLIGNNEQDSFINASKSNRKYSSTSADTSNVCHEILFKTLPESDNNHDTSLSGSILKITHNEVQPSLNVALQNSSKHFGPGYGFELIHRSSNIQSTELLKKHSGVSNQDEFPENISSAFQPQKKIETRDTKIRVVSENSLGDDIEVAVPIDLRLKKHICLDCGERFSCKSKLERHSVVHSGIKPFNCVICMKSFTQNSGLRKHKLTHTGIADVAGHSQTRQDEYICLVCGREFLYKSQLEIHSVIHSGEKRFTCDICNKCFNQKNNLDRHRRTHTEEKHFQCDVCGKYFNKKFHLKTHAIVHKGNKQA